MRTRSPKKALATAPEPAWQEHHTYCWDCVSYPIGGKARGRCALLHRLVYGSGKDLSCFEHRKG